MILRPSGLISMVPCAVCVGESPKSSGVPSAIAIPELPPVLEYDKGLPVAARGWTDGEVLFGRANDPALVRRHSQPGFWDKLLQCRLSPSRDFPSQQSSPWLVADGELGQVKRPAVEAWLFDYNMPRFWEGVVVGDFT